jgi:hypothetical protein
MTFTLDGFEFPTEPITLAALYCGCEKVYRGHDVHVDGLALCPQPETCTGHQNGITAIETLVHTFVVARRGVRQSAEAVA